MPEQFVIVAYDIADDRRRNRVVKILESYGQRVNYSVFECHLKKRALAAMKKKIAALVHARDDSVLFYELCVPCVAKRDTAGWAPPVVQRGVITI